MAFWAECVRRNWWCVNGFDWISWFSEYDYNNWWNSLTDEQRERIIARRKARREAEHRQVMKSLAMMTATMAYLYDKNPESYRFWEMAKRLRI